MHRNIVKVAAIALAAAFAIQMPAPAVAAESTVRRLAGETRYGTMSQIVEASFESSEWAIIASGDTFPDSLAASGVAGAYSAPIILTGKTSLAPEAKAQLERLGVKHVIILGGTNAVSAEVEKAISDMGISVDKRLGGNTRVETSLLAALEVDDRNIDTVGYAGGTLIIASAANYPDGLSASSYAFATASPIMLVDASGLTDVAKDNIGIAGYSRAVIMGGTAAVPESVEKDLTALGISESIRISGADRYETSIMMARFGIDDQRLSGQGPVIASGENFPDALAGGSLAGNRAAILLLVDGDDPNCKTIAALEGSWYADVLGGSSVISNDVMRAIEQMVGEPLGMG